MMTGKTVSIVCLLFALAHIAGSECLLLANVETCQDLPASTCLPMDVRSGQNLPASKWLPLDDDSSRILPADSLHLDVSPNNIFLGQTEILTVNCSLLLSDVSNMSGITSMVLSKSVTKETEKEAEFLDLASMNVFTPNQVKRQSKFDGSVVGQIDNDGLSYIAIEWSNPTDDQAGLFQCKVHGMDDLGYPTEVVQTKRVTSQQPNVEWLTEKVSQLKIQIESQNNLIHNQQVESNKLSALAKSQSNEIKILSSMSKNQSDEIKTLSSLSKNQSDEIHKLTTLGNSQANKISSLSDLSQNQSDEINKLLSLTKTLSQTISDQQSQLKIHSFIFAISKTKLNIETADLPFHISSSYNGHYYLLSKQDWNDDSVSAKTCKDYGGYLAQINNKHENEFVKDFLNRHTGFVYVLISGTDSQHEGRWTYTGTDTDLVFYDWKPGQPDDGVSRNCIYMYKNYEWQWADAVCKHSDKNIKKFICELETV